MQELTSKRHLLRGSAWAVSLRWTVRLSGLISTMILARLLTPADYGVVSIAAIIVGSVEIFSQTGQDLAIIRHSNPTREHFDSAWTVQLLIGFALGAVILATIPVANAYFHEPRAGLVVAVLAVRTMLVGAINTGALNLQRRLQFSKQFIYNIFPSLVAFVVTVTGAFILRNYWALVMGIMSKSVTMVMLSYVVDPFRPRLGFSKIREIWSFSMWTMIRAIGITINYQIDKIVIGGFAGTASMGRYDVARDFATSPTQELILPMITVLVPVMAKVKDDKNALCELYLNVLSWSALICISTGVGVALVAEDLSIVVLGPQWGDVGVLMPWFALSWGVLGISWSASSALETTGHAMVSARLQWIRVFVLTISVSIVAYVSRSIVGVAITTFLVSVAMTPVAFFTLSQVLGIPKRVFATALWRPSLGGALMAMAVTTINFSIHNTGPLRLLLDVSCGASTYIISVMLLWYLGGRPQGIESDACRFISQLARHVGRIIQMVLRRTAS